MGVDNKGCRCSVCRQFRFDDGWTFSVLSQGFCDICKRTDAYLVKWAPDLLKEFLSIKSVCWACRNAITCYVSADWGLCWADDSDDALKWALCDWIRSHRWNYEMRCAA